MKHLVIALLPVCLAAQSFSPSLVLNPKAVNVTHSSARLVWITDSNPSSTTARLWVSNEAQGVSQTAARSSASPWTGSVLFTGLAPSTLYNYRVTLQPSGDNMTGVFVTAAEPSAHPAVPTAPAAMDVTLPTIDGNTYNVAGDCSDLQTHLNTVAGLSGALNHQIVIPAGTTCYGNWIFPNRPSHTGWMVVRSSAAGTAAFPPQNVRWTTNWPVASTLATFVTRVLGMQQAAQTSIADGPLCADDPNYGSGSFYHTTGLPLTLFPLVRCDDDNAAYTGTTGATYSGSDPITITTIDVGNLAEGSTVVFGSGAVAGSPAAGRYFVYDISGNTFKIKTLSKGTGGGSFTVWKRYSNPSHTKDTVDPVGACTEESWWYNTTSGAYWWCVQAAWSRFEKPPTTSEFSHAAIRVQGHKYRFIGLEFKNQQVAGTPNSYPDDWDQQLAGSAAQWNEQGRVQVLAAVGTTGTNANNVIFDRCHFNGIGKPARLNEALWVYGSDFALIESSVTGIARWRSGAPTQNDANGVVFHYIGDRLLLRNNLLEAAGLTYFAVNPDKTDGSNPVRDITIERNEFRKLDAWRKTAGQPWNYPQRHSVEFKQGHRILIRGNLFKYSWSGLNAGSFLLLSPKEPYTMPSAWGLTSCTNSSCTISGSTNRLQEGDVIYISGTANHNGIWEVASNSCPPNCQQFTIISGPTGASSGGTVQARVLGLTAQDIDIRDNTFFQGTEFWRGSIGDPVSSGEYWKRPFARLRVHNNLTVDLDIRAYASGGRVDDNGVYEAAGDNGARSNYFLGGKFEDVIVTHNTLYGHKGGQAPWWGMPSFVVADDTTADASEGTTISDNFFQRDANKTFAPVRGGGSGSGTTTLNERFKRYAADPWSGNAVWTSTKNVMCCGEGSTWSASHPAGYVWPVVEADVKWLKAQLAAGYDFRLRHDSPYQSGSANRASDDQAVGADIDNLDAAQGRVKNARVRNISATSAVVSYFAPDADVCTVEYGTSATWGTGTRSGDGGGDRARSVSLSGLTTGTLYYYRVLCAVEQPSASFRTL